jgi:hypothetical protein
MSEMALAVFPQFHGKDEISLGWHVIDRKIDSACKRLGGPFDFAGVSPQNTK